jgi:two-component system, NarL family, invasion response regulator UvrY
MIRIVIVDDHRLVREGLKKLLTHENDMCVIGEAGDSLEAFELIDRLLPDLLLLDLSLPGRSGLDILADIRLRYPELRTLILSMHPEESWGLRALKAGADGYLGKDVVPDELVTAIRRIHAGRKYITEGLAEALVDDMMQPQAAHAHERLSQREFEVLLLIASGKQPRDIADLLSIGERTVGTYRRRILEKLRLASTADIVHYAIQHRLLGD